MTCLKFLPINTHLNIHGLNYPIKIHNGWMEKPNENKEAMPLILVLGSSLSMGIIMIISMMSSIDRLNSGNATFKNTIFSMLTSVIMLIAILLMPILTRKWEKNQKIKNEKKRQTRYKEYIYSKIELIDKSQMKIKL